YEGVAAAATQTIALSVVDVPQSVSVSIAGTAKEGQVLTAQAVAAEGDDFFTYQWQRSADGGQNWTQISGATAIGYQVQEGDENQLIDVVVTTHDSGGNSASAPSAATAAVVDNSGVSVTVSTVGGTAFQSGQTLVASA